MPVTINGTTGITLTELSPTSVITSSEGIGNFINETSIPTTAAAAAYTQGYTATLSASGTNIDFSSIPSGVSEIAVMFNLVSQTDAGVNGDTLVQLGSSGSPVTTGYNSVCSTYSASRTSTAGFIILNPGATTSFNGILRLYRYPSTNTWIAMGESKINTSATVLDSWGDPITLSGALSIIRVTTVGGGAIVYDGGSISIRCRY